MFLPQKLWTKKLAMSSITFKEAILSDALRISVLLKTVYIQTYAEDGITFEFANFITKRFSTEFIEKLIQERPAPLFIAYNDDNPIGVAEVIYESNCPIRKIATAELSKLYVLQQFYGQGVGYKLLQRAEQVVLENGYNQFNLEVYVKNKRAISFYQRQGYQSIGSVDFPMESNTYENLVMTKILR